MVSNKSKPVEGPLVTQGDIEAGLRAVGVQPGDTPLVHTSLKSFGWVNGHAVAVINALKACVTETGTIVMPSFSADFSDPLHWENPPVPEAWWEEIRATMPVYDPAVTPTIGLGRTPDVFRADHETLRSHHPQVSFAAWGALAQTIVSDHGLAQGLGEGSPLAKLYDLNAKVLFLGTGFGTCTAFHLGEVRSRTRPSIEQGSPLMVEGERRWVTYTEVDFNEAPFADMGAAFEKTHPVSKTKVGWADVRLFSLRDAADFAERALKKESA